MQRKKKHNKHNESKDTKSFAQEPHKFNLNWDGQIG